jgi:hypothetical protein
MSEAPKFKIRHSVIVLFKEGHSYTDPEKAKQVVKAFLDLNNSVGKDLTGAMKLICGIDLGLAGQSKEKGQASFAITADFEHEADYLTYATHPKHVECCQKYMMGQVEAGGRRAVQFNLDSTLPGTLTHL